uniref:Uncharacterized protein n=1 Tax=Picea sitchensis TaxID=3332 RepID=A0A6B9XT83_PICSI|nr:hypothetical protein Q903MT_gene4266 [Picea sitchensis]
MHWLSETLDSIYTHITEPCLQHPSDDRLDSIHRLSSELASSPSSAFSGYKTELRLGRNEYKHRRRGGKEIRNP